MLDDLMRELKASEVALDTAAAEYERKLGVPVVGVFYSWPAWRRYTAAFRNYQYAFHRYFERASRDS